MIIYTKVISTYILSNPVGRYSVDERAWNCRDPYLRWPTENRTFPGKAFFNSPSHIIQRSPFGLSQPGSPLRMLIRSVYAFMSQPASFSRASDRHWASLPIYRGKGFGAPTGFGTRFSRVKYERWQPAVSKVMPLVHGALMQQATLFSMTDQEKPHCWQNLPIHP